MQPSKKSLRKTIAVAPKKLLDYEVRFAELHARALAAGFSPKELSELAAVKRFHRNGTYKVLSAQFLTRVTNSVRATIRFRRCMKLLAGILIFSTVLQFWRLDLCRQSGWVSLFIDKRRLTSEPCVFEMPAKIQSSMMPPFDCNVCKSLRKVSRRSALSPLDFDEMYAYSGVPVLVTDGASNWTALQSFSLDFFERVYRNSDLKTTKNICQFFPYKTEFKGLQDVFNMTAERSRQPWYIGWCLCRPSTAVRLCDGARCWVVFSPHCAHRSRSRIVMTDCYRVTTTRSYNATNDHKPTNCSWNRGRSNCNPGVANILRRHYRAPYFLPSHSEGSTLDWIFMGSPGYGAHLHIDHVGKPSWQAQIRGKKLWTLKPVPECYATCHELRVVVQPGEILVIDSNLWYHKTEVIGEDISIAIGSEYD